MLFSNKSFFHRKIYNKIIILMFSFLLFGLIYYLFCNDYEFGGINILQEEIRNSSLKKFVDQIEKGRINTEVQDEISEQLKKENINKNLDNKISKEIDHPSIEETVPESNNIQRLFDMIYFSVATGTTLGYGDIYPISNKVKFFIILQIFITITILFY